MALRRAFNKAVARCHKSSSHLKVDNAFDVEVWGMHNQAAINSSFLFLSIKKRQSVLSYRLSEASMVHLVLGFSFSLAWCFGKSPAGLDFDEVEKAARKEAASHPRARCIKKAEPSKSSKTPTKANDGGTGAAVVLSFKFSWKCGNDENPVT